MPEADRLLVIDPQRIFADAASPWGSPMFDDALPTMLARVQRYGDRSILTRYVAPRRPSGAWVAYFEQWPFALTAPDTPQYQLVPEIQDAADAVGALAAGTVDTTTFGKWCPALAERLAGVASVEVVGVSTDCCVISTVLALADAGFAVRVNQRGCAGSTLEDNRAALQVMALYGPLVTVT